LTAIFFHFIVVVKNIKNRDSRGRTPALADQTEEIDDQAAFMGLTGFGRV